MKISQEIQTWITQLSVFTMATAFLADLT